MTEKTEVERLTTEEVIAAIYSWCGEHSMTAGQIIDRGNVLLPELVPEKWDFESIKQNDDNAPIVEDHGKYDFGDDCGTSMAVIASAFDKWGKWLRRVDA